MRTPLPVSVPRFAGVPGRPARGGPLVPGLFALAIAAVAAVALMEANTGLALAVPAVIALAIGCALRPALSVVALFALTGAVGSLTAFTPLPVRGATGALLLALWIAVGWRYLAGRERRAWLWPGVVAVTLYVLLTAFELFTASSLSAGFLSFRLGVWPMTAALLLAFAPWPRETYVRIAKGALVVAAGVGLYNLYRWIGGPAPQELAVARGAMPGLPHSQALRFFGSFPTAQELVNWCGTMVPFALAVGLGWRGRWRLLAAAVIALCCLVLVAANVLAGAFAVLAGSGVTLLLYAVARAFPGARRLAVATLATVAVALAGIGAYAIAVNPHSQNGSRFSNLLSPGSDPTYETRLQRWSEVLADVSKHPFGHGLGTAGAAALEQPQLDPSTPTGFDSSYLKVAFEQGMFVMVFFAGALVLLLFGTARRAVLSVDPTAATLGIGACGSLVALAVLFYAGFYVEHVETLSGWLLVGLGVAQFTAPRRRPPRAPESQSAPPGERPELRST